MKIYNRLILIYLFVLNSAYREAPDPIYRSEYNFLQQFLELFYSLKYRFQIQPNLAQFVGILFFRHGKAGQYNLWRSRLSRRLGETKYISRQPRLLQNYFSCYNFSIEMPRYIC